VPSGRRRGRSPRTASAGRVVSAALGNVCGGRGSALLLQQGAWAGELSEGLCNRGFVPVVTFFCIIGLMAEGGSRWGRVVERGGAG